MNHDPMCPIGYAVAKAKSDGVPKETYLPNPLICLCDHNLRVREDEAVKRRADLIWQDGYDIALRDAVYAAGKQRSKFKARDWDDAVDAVVAAIQDLGGKR